MSILRDEFLWQPSWQFVFEADWHDRVRRLKADKAITTRLLVNRSTIERRKAAYYKSRKHLERRYLKRPIERFGLYLVDDTAAILSFDNANLLGIRIVNRHIADNLAVLFESLWT